MFLARPAPIVRSHYLEVAGQTDEMTRTGAVRHFHGSAALRTLRPNVREFGDTAFDQALDQALDRPAAHGAKRGLHTKFKGQEGGLLRGDEVVEVLDIYHAREHLHALAHTVHRREDEATTWAKAVGEAMEVEGPQPVLKAIQALTPRGKKQREEVRKALDYFTTNAGRMDYPTYAAHHWPIGSGIIESTCRLVSNLRAKQPGMRWSEAGVQATLALRSLALSHGAWWADFFRRQPQRRRPPVASLTRSASASVQTRGHASAA